MSFSDHEKSKLEEHNLDITVSESTELSNRFNYKEREEVIRKFLEEQCIPLLRSKGQDYTEGLEQGVNGNFHVVGDLTGVGPYKAWFVYFTKHFTALVRWLKKGKVESESIEGRIADMVNYLLILYSMLVEEERKNANWRLK